MYDACPRCGCEQIVMIGRSGKYPVDPRQRCECDVHLECGWVDVHIRRTGRKAH